MKRERERERERGRGRGRGRERGREGWCGRERDGKTITHVRRGNGTFKMRRGP